MKITTTIDEVQYAASICLKCGCCTYGDWPENHHLCSIFYRDEVFTHGGGGFMALVAAMGENLINMDEKLAGLAYACASCLACDSRCTIIKAHKPQVDMIDMIRLLRYEAVKKGMIPEGYARDIYNKVKDNTGPDGTMAAAVPESLVNPAAPKVLYTQAAGSDAEKEVVAAVSSILQKIGEPMGVYEDGGWCGSTLYDLGIWDQLPNVINTNWEKMSGQKDKEFVFTSPHCLEFITQRYPENVAGYTDIKSQHISQLIAEALESGKLKSKNSDKVTVSYHDPCYLGRGMGIYEPPRQALSAMEGVTLVEMPRNRKAAYCCGAKVTGNYFSEQAEYTAMERIKEFRNTGADLLITACAHCKDAFRRVLPEADKAKVVDLSEFINDRV